MGSQHIGNLGYREGFSFVGIVGKNSALDKKSGNTKERVAVSKVFHMKRGAPYDVITDMRSGSFIPKQKETGVMGTIDRESVEFE